MSLRDLRLTVAVIACVLAGLFASPAAAAPARAAQAEPGVYAPEDNFTAVWTRAQALKVRLDPTNTKPRIPADFPVMTDEVWVWDTWPLTNLGTKPISYKGWNVIFSLVAPRTLGFQARHEVATIGYFFSRDAKTWEYGGTVFPRGTARGARQWAGSAVLIGDEVNLMYTASGDNENPPVPDPNWQQNANQRIALASATIRANEDGVWFAGQSFRNSRIVAEADGRYYQTEAQAAGGPTLMAFRDPFLFRDPADDQIYMLFEGNTGGPVGSHTCTPQELGPLPPGHEVPANANRYTGNIGLARATSANLRRWELLPPLLSANCVNQQTERPHLVIEDGAYYLFTISHTFTYAPGLTGPDGVYGWLGDSLRSNYQPLNASALVLGNPADAPFQAYSEYVMPNWLVEAFIDQVPDGSGGLRDGGTLAPTIRLEVDGTNTYVVEVLDYGFIPAMANAGGALSAAARR
jgi:levansucrase